MAQTLIVLDDQAQAQTFPFGTTAASGEALVTINKGTTAATTVVLDVKASANIGGDLNVTGNINLTGAINETTVTNLKVTDKTITTNVGGTSAGASGAGLLIEGDSAAVIAKFIYDSSLGTKFKIGDGSAQAEVVDVSTAQTLTNKTLTSPAITTPTGIVKGDVGLGNVDNTSDANKPVSTATQTALNLKANAGANTDITSVLLNQTGLVVKGATANALTIKPNETLTGGRTLSIVTGDSNRSITFTADTTIGGTHSGTSSGTNTGDQTISDSTISTTDITTNDVTSTKHGFAPKSPADATKFLNGAATPAYANVQDSDLSTTDITTNNFTTAKHGFVPKGTNVGNYLRDDGTWSAVASSTYTRFTTVSGTQDGANKVFTIGNALTANTEMVYRNGQLLTPGGTNDYVISGTTLTFQAAHPAPLAGTVIRVYGNF
jgi:hypothetical protein